MIAGRARARPSPPPPRPARAPPGPGAHAGSRCRPRAGRRPRARGGSARRTRSARRSGPGAPDAVPRRRSPARSWIEHRIAGGERRGGRAEVGRRVEQAAQRRRFAGRGRRHRLERVGARGRSGGCRRRRRAVRGAAGRRGGRSRSCGLRRGRGCAGDGCRRAGCCPAGSSPAPSSSERSLAAWRAMNSAKVDVGAGEGARRSRLDELEHRAVPADRRRAARRGWPRRRAGGATSASARSSRLVGAKVGDHEPAAGAQHLPDGRAADSRRALILGGRAAACAGCVRVRTRNVVVALWRARSCTRSRPTPSAATRARVSRGARRSRLVRTRRGGCRDRRLLGRVRRRRVFGAQQRLDVAAPVAPVAARTAVAGQLAGVAPAPQRVEADAELGRRFAEAEPAFAVRSSYAHVPGGGSGLPDAQKFPNSDQQSCRRSWHARRMGR